MPTPRYGIFYKHFTAAQGNITIHLLRVIYSAWELVMCEEIEF